MKKILYSMMLLTSSAIAFNGTAKAQFKNISKGSDIEGKADSSLVEAKFEGEVVFVKHIDDFPVFKVSLGNIPKKGCMLIIRNDFNEIIHREYVPGRKGQFRKLYRFLSAEDNEYRFTVTSGKEELVRKRFAINNYTASTQQVIEKD